MNKVLVIAYYFPPLGLSGVQRISKFVKYLPEFGWEPTVLTVGEVAYYAKDYSLLREIESKNIRIIRTSTFDPNAMLKKRDIVSIPSEKIRKFLSRVSDTFFIPDNKIGWYKSAVKKGTEILEKEKFDLIFSTAPPYTDFLIGNALKNKFKIPLVLDYRDAWTDYLYKYYPTPLHKYINFRLEKKILHNSDYVITASRSVKEMLIQRYSFLNHNNVTLLPQGFDKEDFQNLKDVNLPKNEKMRITFAGVFYEDRSPEKFLKAIEQIVKFYPKIKNKIEIYFIGAIQTEYRKMVENLGLNNVVNILGYLEHKECLRYLVSSDVLWFVMNDDKSSPGKIFEYIGTGKKIFGLIPNGYMKKIVEEANGVCANPEDIEGIKNKIIELFSQFEKNELNGASAEIVDKYDRKNITFELSKIFQKQLLVI